jgi:hypothetical protein
MAVRKTNPKTSVYYPDENGRAGGTSDDGVDSWFASEFATGDVSSPALLAWRRLWNRLLSTADEDSQAEASEPSVTTDR